MKAIEETNDAEEEEEATEAADDDAAAAWCSRALHIRPGPLSPFATTQALKLRVSLHRRTNGAPYAA